MAGRLLRATSGVALVPNGQYSTNIETAGSTRERQGLIASLLAVSVCNYNVTSSTPRPNDIEVSLTTHPDDCTEYQSLCHAYSLDIASNLTVNDANHTQWSHHQNTNSLRQNHPFLHQKILSFPYLQNESTNKN